MVNLPRKYLSHTDFSESTAEVFLFYQFALDHAIHSDPAAQDVKTGVMMLVDTPATRRKSR